MDLSQSCSVMSGNVMSSLEQSQSDYVTSDELVQDFLLAESDVDFR